MKSKKKKNNILDLELRNKIYHLVSKHAGAHLRELERISKIPYSTLKYHLHFLVKHDLILEKKENANTKYYPKTIKFEDIEILSLLRQKNIRKILMQLLTNPKTSFSDLENATNLSPSTTSWYIHKLTRNNIIEKHKIQSKTLYKLIYNRDKIIRILITYKKSFADTLIDKTLDAWDIG